MMMLPAAQAEPEGGASGETPILKNVNWNPKRRAGSPAVRRWPVKYHHSVL